MARCRILGVAPVLGRLFNRKDDSAGAPQTVVLSYGYWQRKFGGASSVIGRSLTVGGKPREIIGVLPQGFHFLDQPDVALFLPFQWDRNKTKLGDFSERALARLKPGVTMAQASTDMARLLPVVLRSFPAPEGFSVSIFEKVRLAPNLRPLKQDVVGNVGNVLWVSDGLDRSGSAGRLRKRCQSVAGPGRRAPSGAGDSLCSGCWLGTHRGRAALGELRPRRCRQPDRAGIGLWCVAPSGVDGAHRPSPHP